MIILGKRDFESIIKFIETGEQIEIEEEEEEEEEEEDDNDDEINETMDGEEEIVINSRENAFEEEHIKDEL